MGMDFALFSTMLLTFATLLFSTYTGASSFTESSGKYVSTIGNQAAVANREIADQLFKDALKHEQQGWATMNIPMIVQSLQESLDGVKANNQSRELGRSALGAIDTGKTGGHLNEKDYGKMSQEDLKKFSDSSSQHLPLVKGKLDSWGIQVSYDNKKVSTGDGDSFDIDQLDSKKVFDLIKEKATQRGVGLLVTDEKIKAGIQQALKNRKEIAKNVFKKVNDFELESKIKAEATPSTPKKVAIKKAASAAPATTKELAKSQPAPVDESEKKFKELFPDHISPAQPAGELKDIHTQAREAELKYDRYRRLTESRLNIQDKNRIGTAEQNLFRMVQIRYQSLRQERKFIPVKRRAPKIKIAKHP